MSSAVRGVDDGYENEFEEIDLSNHEIDREQLELLSNSDNSVSWIADALLDSL